MPQNFKTRIPLGNGKWAFEQTEEFAAAAETELARIHRVWSPPKFFYHLRSGGHVAATRRHMRSEWFGKIDLKQIFEQVTRNRIIKRLCALGYNFEEATNFAVSSTVKAASPREAFVLPYGFVQSPTLASIDMEMSHLGRTLRKISASELVLTVYVDDILISGTTRAPVDEALAEIRNAATTARYLINEAKSTPAADGVTAFNIDIAPNSMAITRSRLDEFGAAIMTAGRGQRSRAILGYIRTVNPTQSALIEKIFHRHLGC